MSLCLFWGYPNSKFTNYKLQIKPDLHPFPSQDYFHSDKFYSLVSREINMYILDIIRGGFRFTYIKSDP